MTNTDEIATTPRWRSDWERCHEAIAGRAPQRRHLTLARILYLARVSARAAAYTTATTAMAERQLQRQGVDVEVVAAEVRKRLLIAALMRIA